MRLLLDTHIAIWAVASSERLTETEATLIADSQYEVFVSVASLWEIAIKFSARAPRRYRFGMPFGAEKARAAFVAAQFHLLPVVADHVLEVERLPSLHNDPFDRLLVAQARSEPMRLMTRDRLVLDYL